MVLELHVWGPAFSLPSIEARSLATIAYFVLAVPKDEWVLVPSSDPSVSPTNELPALRNGNTWVSRFRNIVDYLRQYSGGEWDLDGWSTGLERADNIAFASFIESRGQSLLDLSLYVSSQNYYGSTSPAYGTILTWPNMWILPPKLRDGAKTRTEHLGLSSLDLDAIEEQRNRDQSSAIVAAKIPKSLIKRPRDTVSSLLGRTPQQNQFKLEALTAEFFEPFEELLGNKSYLLSDEHPSSLDCLAIGYLSLALVPELPYPWLRESLRTKAPRLAEFTERMRRRCFGIVDVSSVFEPNGTVSSLPWKIPERVTMAKIGSTLVNTLADSTPIVKDLRATDRLRDAARAPNSGLTPEESKAISEVSQAQKRDMFVSIATVAAGVTAFVGYLFHVGLIQVSLGGGNEEEEDEGVETNFDMGALGDALSGL
ncbi:mitochondrial import receptor subunit (Tom37), putative [Paecilomyces variotii No. 5]|uniref:Mitochondrial import receptor subunit (Tom37), putative n=1 Tax=Byssochlamys spectabilis (strain No. 5 / NBRC 109023) TaxID=1356009 RepID=V5FKZ4_BYSSN|nr:mitochondrial import receptor subunit (Tom37), putative [Paecilomyces variotii No. 5]